MIKKEKISKDNIVKFPSKLSDLEKEIEAVIFAAAEPLDVDTIESKVTKKGSVPKSLEKLQQEYSKRGINLVCIKEKWSFRTSPNLSNIMSQERTVEKKLSRALESFFSTVLSCDIIFDKLGEVLKDHFSFMQTRLIPRLEYSCCNFSNDLGTLPFLVTLLSIVSTSNGSAAAKITASISFSKSDSLDGNLTILSFEIFSFLIIIFLHINIIK